MIFDNEWQKKAFGDLQSCVGTPLDDLINAQLVALQRGLWWCGYDAGPIDGLLGNRTRSAWSEFTTDSGLEGDAAVIAMEDRIDAVIYALTLEQENYERSTSQSTESIGQKAIVAVAKAMGICQQYQQIAYIFATVQHETAAQWKPVIEAYWMPDGWQDDNLRYAPFYGRGFVQLTWESNYEKYGEILCIPLLRAPGLALNYGVSLFVLINGFHTGAFTGKYLEHYVRPPVAVDYHNARRCINGTDKAAEIAALAVGYEQAAKSWREKHDG